MEKVLKWEDVYRANRQRGGRAECLSVVKQIYGITFRADDSTDSSFCKNGDEQLYILIELNVLHKLHI